MVFYGTENGSHVLCEKPLCADEEEVARIIEVRDKSGKFVYSEGNTLYVLGIPCHGKEIEPMFEYLFENGVDYYGKRDTERAHQLLPEDYIEYGFVVGYMNDGERIIYGDSMAEVYNKLYALVDAVLEGRCDNGPCGVETAAVQTYVINKIQSENEIQTYKKEQVKYLDIEYGYYYVEGVSLSVCEAE